MSSPQTLAGALAAAAPGRVPHGGDGAAAGEGTPDGGFTALLAAALGSSDPAVVAEALQGLQDGEDAGAAASAVPPQGPEAEVSAEALQQAIAALVAEHGPLRLPAERRADAMRVGTVARDTGGSSAVSTGAARAALLSALRAAATARRTPTTDPAGQVPTTGTSTGPARAGQASIPATVGPQQATPAGPGGLPIPGEVSVTSTRSSAPTVAAPPSLPPDGGAAADATVPAPAPVASAGTGTATTAAPAGAPPAPTDGGLHARVVSRVIEAVELLEHAPPPRRMTVEVPDGDGLRLQVAMRGAEVHVSLHAGRGAPDLGAWGRELAAGLASRGMSLGGFGSGDAAQPGPDHQRGRDGQPRPADRPDHRPRDDGRPRPPRDGDLRL